MRLAEINKLFHAIRQTLEEMLEQLRAGEGTKPADVLKKIGELQTAHIKVLEQEKAYHDSLGQKDGPEALDFDAIRAEIGRRLDRIRAVQDADDVSGEIAFRSHRSPPVSF
ncbi:hypothetical protein SAMN05444714_0976 [Yoonia litorea]|uniref:Uncharacterized protein n=2 Tax=Yoonia litorea TaxID=1123755 RepID=A0A1I6LX01_9RHOB|nr:hypothetical protein SAMN05444714_0976 [Yoonia litorea]